MQIQIEDLENLALGAAILGSGGGGSPSYNRLIAQNMIEKYGPVKMLKVEKLSENDLVVPVAFMGAPLVGIEKIPSGKEFAQIVEAIEKHTNRRVTALISGEIGGGNALTPIWAAAMLKLPIVDGDLIGRAFPELQMTACTIKGIPPAPAFMADSLGNHVTLNASDPLTIERFARQITIGMGSRAAIAFHLLDANQAKDTVVRGSVSKALEIGRSITHAKNQNLNPITALLKATQGIRLASGMLTDINYNIEGGFLKGSVILLDECGKEITILFQNEYLLASSKDEILSTTPNIIMLTEQGTCAPITSAALRYGLRVDLITFAPADIWLTPKGLSLVGPQYFGYDTDYIPINSINKVRSI